MRQKLIILPKLYNAKGDHSKQWFVYFSVRDPETGKMVRFRIYDGFHDLSIRGRYDYAKTQIDIYTMKLQSGWSPFSDNTSYIYNDNLEYKSIADIYGTQRKSNNVLRRLTSEYLDEIKYGISEATYSTYKSKLRIFCLWSDKEKLSDNDITAYYNHLIRKFFIFLIETKKLSGNSIKKYKHTLTAFFQFCIKKDLLRINPVYDIPNCNRINDNTPMPIMKSDIQIFKKRLILDPELWLAIQFQFYCALRPGHELRELHIKDIDFISGSIRISRTHAKTRIERYITIPQQFLIELRNNYKLHTYNKNFFVFGKEGHPGEKVIGKNKLRYKFNKVRKELNMPNEYKLYSWKHTGAIEADEALIPMKDISRHLGHTSLQSTDSYFKNKRPGTSKAIKDNYPSL